MPLAAVLVGNRSTLAPLTPEQRAVRNEVRRDMDEHFDPRALVGLNIGVPQLWNENDRLEWLRLDPRIEADTDPRG